MKYICEDNINFYDLINEDNEDTNNYNNNTINDSINDSINQQVNNVNTIINNNIDINSQNNDNCLISNLPLDITCVELPCKHKFNYYYLYHDIYNQKKNFNPYSSTLHRPTSDMINCPYCRKRLHCLLPPALDIKNVKSTLTINSPKVFCLKLKCCINNYNKNEIQSNIEPCIDDLVYVTPYGNFCLMHYKLIKYSKKRKERMKNKHNKSEYPIAELSKYEKKYKVAELREICKNNNTDINGTKKDMIIRLYNNKYDFSKQS
jgi:hypothetical protein